MGFQARTDVELAGILNNGGMGHGSREAAGDSLPGTWQDPQIHLLTRASGRSACPCYDITDFVTGEKTADITAESQEGKYIVIKSGDTAKLESITLSQRSIANLAIMYRLLGERKLVWKGVVDYCCSRQRFTS